MTTEHCPLCGGAVEVESADEGTNHFRPVTTLPALAAEILVLVQEYADADDSAIASARRLSPNDDVAWDRADRRRSAARDRLLAIAVDLGQHDVIETRT